MRELRRTTPFIAAGRQARGPVVLLDRAEIPATGVTRALAERLSRPLRLGSAEDCLPAAQVEAVVEEQYEACLEFIYGHPAWQQIRDGESRPLLSYLLESRHYLSAAPYRMASGITGALTPNDLTRLQAHHVVEEYDHDTYFENGLAEMGCDRDVVRAARPAPVTVEWIHLMRAVADQGPLPAAICSGLLEYTAGGADVVRGWHDMLIEQQTVPPSAIRAIFEHVETDLGLGHGSNWRDAIRAAGVIPARELADILNSVTLVAEMIVRWLDCFEPGLSADLVASLPGLTVPDGDRTLAGELAAAPVWPAEVYESVAHGPRASRPGVRRALAVAYAFAGEVEARPDGDDADAARSVVEAAAEFTRRSAVAPPAEFDGDLVKLVESWLTAIDGHALWTEMVERPTYPLVYGWMVENYHYVAGIWQHCGAAVAACTDPRLRGLLVHHLIEEFQHGRMFQRGIERGRREEYGDLPLVRTRALPTTVAFVGALRGLAERNWRAYLLGLGFLQLSLAASDGGVGERHERFYDTLVTALPDSEALLRAMRQHDAEDTRLGHGDDTIEMLRLLGERHRLTASDLSEAALVPQLTWSFLDGIRQHYGVGEAAVRQRTGWYVDR